MSTVTAFEAKVKLSFDSADKLWYADCLNLQGAHTFGTTKEEALENILDVIGDRIFANIASVKDQVAKKAHRRAAGWATKTTTEVLEIPA